MASGIAPILGMPGVRAIKTAGFKHVFRGGFNQDYLPGGRVISGAAARDPSNTGFIDQLQPGLLMGKITATGEYAPSVIGLSTGALTGSGTTLSTSAAIATEIVRRLGATGTLKLTGPATAAGTVRTLTATYSAVNTGTGDVTISALGVNEVQTVTFNIAATGGNVVLRVPKTDGTFVLTTPAAWSATDATFLGNINTVLDAATGVTGGIVASAIAATDTDLGFKLTFSGTGYAGVAQPTEMVSVETLPTSSTSYTVTRTTAGVPGAFVTASLIQPVDGSETILTFLPDGTPIKVTDGDGTSQDTPFPELPISGTVETAQLVNYPADAALKLYIKAALNTYGKFVFDDSY